MYGQRYPEKRLPSRAAFDCLIKTFRETGSVCSRKKMRSRLQTNEPAEVTVLAAVANNPHISSRQIQRNTGISKTSVLRILKRHSFHPYHIALHQELHGNDFINRIEFCQWALQQLEVNEFFFNRILFTDESTFTNHGQVNRRNMHYWSVENPRWLRQVERQRPWSLNVCCGVLRVARTVLHEMFPERWIGRGGYISWPARSPDLNPLDFFFYLGRRLFQQWLVDSYVKIEKDRTDYCKAHQKELKIAAFVYVIEFQKCGLPHVHILITLKHTFKITTPQIVDKYISAEIPDSCENRTLHDIVMRHMIHGPCGDWCLVDGKYSKARYVGPVEASWRILEKKLQDKSHTVIRLPVHLPNEQNIIIENGSNEDTITSALDQVTMLIDYFALNSRDEKATEYLYIEILRYYTFKKEKINNRTVLRWNNRKYHYNCIGRMYSVSPTQTELYHLRLLLLTVKGETSFENLRTVNGEICPSFSAACLALGLIDDDDEWKRAINEAVGWMMPRQLTAMSEDYFRHFGMIQGQKKAYAQINAMLCAESKSLADFPQMEQLQENNEEEDFMTLEQIMKNGTRQYNQLNKKQKEIIDIILNILDNNCYNNNCFYIDGPGGSGKTFIYTTIYYLYIITKIRNKHVCTMAFTGIAVTLLPAGKTVHKTFGLPVPLFVDSSSSIKIFIWDEAPMAPRYALEFMDRTLRDIMNNELPFGGKIIILGGDFRQLLPIMIHGTRCEIVNLSIKAKCAILSARNADVDEINKRVIDLLDISEERIYISTDSTENCCDNFDRIGIDLRKDVFNHGQLYVAFSRVRAIFRSCFIRRWHCYISVYRTCY
ncbi:hypothetical protein X777_10741 [Ooceraea biroi]|uniref:ATP-dependent DNA helicase n=1 Tax=Ooceraea biroi TaxID=2015173 RepID=A0A026W7B2_OOCBI|nr:hypothetical protein X777_10741 [Ooceraea biroi]